MEFHYVISYNTDTKKWRKEDVDDYLPDGNVYDVAQAQVMDVGWKYPDSDFEVMIDERCNNMLNALVTIWPEVDHGE